ncbi:transposase [Nocardia sp. NPDC046763]|uniref:transposase n=1 Tax=Nocardia sp. NPDC046763 TaxID=3155256 RepID=UPI0033EA0291
MRSVPELTLTTEHRRGHGAMYEGLNAGRIDIVRLRNLLCGSGLPRFPDGPSVSAVDVPAWLRSDAACSPGRNGGPAAVGSGDAAAETTPAPTTPRAGGHPNTARNSDSPILPAGHDQWLRRPPRPAATAKPRHRRGIVSTPGSPIARRGSTTTGRSRS